MDYLGLGFAYLSLGVAIFVALVIFLIDLEVKILVKENNKFAKYFCGLLLAISIITLIYTANFCETQGFVYITDGQQFEQQNQVIIVNLTCLDSKNCTANIPNNLQISCPIQTSAQQNQTPYSQLTKYQNCPKKVSCPPMLSIPKI